MTAGTFPRYFASWGGLILSLLVMENEREKQEQKGASAGAGSARLITGGALEDGAAEADAPPATFG
jgi:hypothetical protein